MKKEVLLSKIELFHDFNKLHDSDKKGYAVAPLVCNGTTMQIEKEGIVLFEGLKLLLIDPDGVDKHGNPDCLEVDATISFDKEHNCWCGEFLYSELKYKSEK